MVKGPLTLEEVRVWCIIKVLHTAMGTAMPTPVTYSESCLVLSGPSESLCKHELELGQLHMTQKARLWGEVSTRAWRVCSQTRKGLWASAGGERRLGETACVVKPIKE